VWFRPLTFFRSLSRGVYGACVPFQSLYRILRFHRPLKLPRNSPFYPGWRGVEWCEILFSPSSQISFLTYLFQRPMSTKPFPLFCLSCLWEKSHYQSSLFFFAFFLWEDTAPYPPSLSFRLIRGSFFKFFLAGTQKRGRRDGGATPFLHTSFAALAHVRPRKPQGKSHTCLFLPTFPSPFGP